ncbi:Rha family transcriptional regulator [Virgibacillus oceani]|uniref:Antirepressor n=1 Tax=Virgibacillus oceani TaxID=1479511 RepID=A0A917H1F5_9BACI|nr:Rha family transcriptional regulator [Virgibacillus oceani]GGG64503.1 antirepressor [Virgibacillus oceani]
MNQLVFIQDKQVVTDSLTVAEVFEKNHKEVLRDIRNLECSDEFSQRNFAPSTYKNDRGREYECYVMKQDGFSFLVMGYTGKKAAYFKEQYINEFNHMRQQLTGTRVLSEREQRIESMKLTLDTAQRQDKMDSRLNSLESKIEEQITLDHGEQRRFQKGVANRVYSFTEDQDEIRKLFRELYRDIKDRFGVSSYKDVKRKDLQIALKYIENWIPRQVS